MKKTAPILPLIALLFSAWAVPLAPPAAAADHSFGVGSTADTTDANIGDGKCKDSKGNCTLRAAIQEANALGGTTNITLNVAGTYTLTITGKDEDKAAKGDLDIRSSINLYAPNGSGNATVTGKSGFGDRIFDIPAGTASMSVVFEPRLIVKGGTAPSGEDGGGIRSVNTGYLNLNQMTVKSSTARNGGGVYATGPSSSSLNTNLATFSSNTATGNGGGLDIEGGMTATLGNFSADNNKASQGGGLAAFIADGSTGSVVSTSGAASVTSNTATAAGGGMSVSHFNGRSFTIDGNSAPKGGGLQIIGTNGPSYINGRTYITNNAATGGKGGGVYGSCKTNCGMLGQVTIEKNTSTDDGAGLYLTGGLTFERGLVDSNTASGNGGGINHFGDLALVMTNVTVTGNKTNVGGSPTSGGVVDQATVTDTYTNDTIAQNTGGTHDGVVVTGTGSVAPKVKNSIVSDTGTGTSLCNKHLTSQGHNIDSGNSCGFSSTGDMTNTDPQVRVLSDNGGGVHTMMLQEMSSPALDAGDDNGCPMTDARWVMRPQDGDQNGSTHCDIGAYEWGVSLLNSDVGVTVTPSNSNPKPGDTVTYTVTFTNIGESGTFESLVSDAGPSQLTLQSCSGTGVTCKVQGNVASLTFPTIGLSNPPTMTIVAKVNSGVSKGTAIVNSVTTWAKNPDSNQSNNAGSATVTVS